MEAGSKMGVEESVSFGRFTGESLSWDRWSSFSQNKYMEEAEKCSTPGSVAQKKAYFEAHYKKIAARKAELLEQEKHAEADSLKSHKPEFGDAADNGWNSEYTDGMAEQVDAENADETKGVNTNGNDIESNTGIDELKQDTANGECEGPSNDSAREELADTPSSLRLEELKVDASVEEEKHFPDSELPIDLLIEQPTQDHIRTETNQASKPDEAVKQKSPSKQSQKKTPTRPLEKNTAAIKSKAEISTLKSGNSTITTVLKASPASPISSAAKASIRKDNTTRPKGKNTSITENKRPIPSSLVISSNISDSVPTVTTRRSLIMEKMGDKEIVRRAFKTFQKRIAPSDDSEDAKSFTPRKVPVNGKEKNSPASGTPTKRNERDRKLAEKPNTQRRLVDSQVPSVSTRPSKLAGASKQVSKSTSPSPGLRTIARPVKQREAFICQLLSSYLLNKYGVIGVKERLKKQAVRGAAFGSSMIRWSHSKGAMNEEVGIMVH